MTEQIKQLRVVTVAIGCVAVVLSAFLCGCSSPKEEQPETPEKATKRTPATKPAPVVTPPAVTGAEPKRKARIQALFKQLADESPENRQAAFAELRDTLRKRDIPELEKEIVREDTPFEVMDLLMKLQPEVEGRLRLPDKGWTTDLTECIRRWEKEFQNLGCQADVSTVGLSLRIRLDVRISPEKWAGAVKRIFILEPESLTLRGALTNITFPGTLASLKSLDLEHAEVTDLKLLKWLPNLGGLRLPKTQVTDLTPLKWLPNLGGLDLQNSKVTDLTPLKGLRNLAWLELQNTEVTDLTPLKGMQKLRRLELQNSKVTDLTPLKGLPNLRKLYLQNTKVADLTPLKGLPNLWWLHLQNTKVADLTPLEGMPNLGELDLRNTGVTDLTPLKGLPELWGLYLQNTKVTDLTPLKGMPELKELYLSNTAVADLTPLKDMPKLRFLGLSDTKVTDLSPLKGLPNLERLSLQNTGVTHLAPLRGLSKLSALFLKNTKVTSLHGLPSLSRLDLQNTEVTSLQGLPSVGDLDLRNTGVTDLTPLKGQRYLRELDISNTGVTDLSPLREAPQLTTLIANNVPNLKSLDPLMNRKMYHLEIGGTSIAKETVLKFIASQPKLKSLGLADMAITDTDLATLPDREYRSLDLSSTKVTDLSEIDCSGLGVLKINNTSIKVLPPDVRKLVRLEIRNTKLDPGVLLRFPDLYWLKLTVDPTDRELVRILEKLRDSCEINDLSKNTFLNKLKEK